MYKIVHIMPMHHIARSHQPHNALHPSSTLETSTVYVQASHIPSVELVVPLEIISIK